MSNFKNNEPIWINNDDTAKKETNKKPGIFLATPVHSNLSIHYFLSVLSFQNRCFINKTLLNVGINKSSLVTQGRNLCVNDFFKPENNPKTDYLLFIDSDIDFESNTIFKMIGADKDIISCPYPMKTFDTDKMWRTIKETNIVKTKDDVLKAAHVFPIKIGDNELKMEHGVIKVTHAPTGCMLIKREVIEKMIKHHPELEIYQPTIINGKEDKKDNMFNLFDTLHDVETKRYFGEDFGFCQRWGDMGGEVHIYVLDNITHVGDHQYCGRFYDLLESAKSVDDSEKIK